MRSGSWVCGWLAVLLTFPVLGATVARGQESLCARVKIEIAQELTLERQAFDARMKINNGLDTIVLENVDVAVQFADEDGTPVLATSDPNDTSALFFIRLDSMSGISDVSGSGTVAPSSSAEIHWLIIPASGAAANQLQGKRYQVGATLRYNLGGEAKVVEVAPDWITVAPQPRLVLDYFLTRDVFADDPFTPLIEPIEPFTLGVRVRNEGFGVAHNLAIDSAQPKIVENDLGLLIGFVLTGSFVDDLPAAPTLRIGLGDIAPLSARVGRWVMETTLSGKFTEFSAQFTHADSLGGRLTSLIDSVNTHLLVHDVRVDLPGRDRVRDFLALDGDTLRVYESDSVDTAVVDQSTASTLTALGGGNHRLSTPVTAGMLFVRLPDPYAGGMQIRSVLRGDGKVLPAENAWTSKTGDGHVGFQHLLNVFDVNGGGQYTLQMGAITAGAVPPVLQFVPDRSTSETQRISFIVQATDANGTIPSLSAQNLPGGATFVDRGTGVGLFDWTPADGQAGAYPITYRASDGALSASRTAFIYVNRDAGTPTPTVAGGPTPTWTPTAIGAPTETPTPTPTPTLAGDITGRLRFYGADRPVPAARVQLSGCADQTVVTDAGGGYAFSTVPAGDCRIEVTRTDPSVAGISALDAVWVLQEVVRARNPLFDAFQKLACDVTGNGAISARDAALILQRVVGGTSTFPAAQLCGSDWAFWPMAAAVSGQTPLSPQLSGTTCQQGALTFAPLSPPVSGQDFYGVKFGDCTGNWRPPVGGGAAAAVAGAPHVTLGRPRPGPRAGLRVPVYVRATIPFVALELELTHDPLAARVTRVRSARTGEGTLVRFGSDDGGLVKLALASANPIEGGASPVLSLDVEPLDGVAGERLELRSALVDDVPTVVE